MPAATLFPLFFSLLALTAAAPPGFDQLPKQLDISRWRNKRLMVVMAHPDDAEFFAGGTLAALQARNDLNVSVAYLIITSGNAGGRCYNSSGAYQPPSYRCESEELAFLRRKEMLAAGRVLGVDSDYVWRCGFGDGMLVSVHESAVRERIAAYARRFRPDIVISHYPYPNFKAPQTCNGQCTDEQRRWDDLGYHPDHKRVGLHVLNTFYGGGSAADNNHLFLELDEVGGLSKWHVSELYFTALTRDQPITHYMPLTEELLRRKGLALAKHRTQYDGPPTDSIRWFGEQVAKEANAASPILFAEGFQAFY